MTTFGAPAGADARGGHHGVDSDQYRPTTPPNRSLIDGRLRRRL